MTAPTLAPAAERLGFNGGLTCSMQCADLDATIGWFTDTLGFSLLYKVDEIAWAEMVSPVGGVNVGFSQVEKPDVKGGCTLTWGVEDIDSARATLEERGVRFDGETITYPGMVKLATFFDPDGNHFMLFQALGEC
ncbi:MAG: VOC family protein [Planctomycetota bacterium]|jgi:predicted enzyme related to lactoylglutathione lyase